ncbi:MAG: tetratricopeptide repeat protein [Gemmatimonadaceae bacterium]|nr:tetratricopeptide repeat protein [Gemmatimonadaceae bacterium]
MADFEETGLDAAGDFFRQYKRPITIGGGVLVVATAALFLWKQSQATRIENAEKAFFQAQSTAAQGNAQLALADLQKVATRYAGTNAGDRATLVVAQLLLEQGKTADAITRLEALAKAGGEARLGATLPTVLGAAYENLNKHAEAAAQYEKAATLAPSDQEKAQRRADAARAFSAAGQKAKAKELWVALAKDERGLLAQEARVRLGELEYAR